jgi:hypothetical protein
MTAQWRLLTDIWCFDCQPGRRSQRRIAANIAKLPELLRKA